LITGSFKQTVGTQPHKKRRRHPALSTTAIRNDRIKKTVLGKTAGGGGCFFCVFREVGWIFEHEETLELGRCFKNKRDKQGRLYTTSKESTIEGVVDDLVEGENRFTIGRNPFANH